MHWLEKLKFVLISKKVLEKIAYICITVCKSSHNGKAAKIFEVSSSRKVNAEWETCLLILQILSSFISSYLRSSWWFWLKPSLSRDRSSSFQFFLLFSREGIPDAFPSIRSLEYLSTQQSLLQLCKSRLFSVLKIFTILSTIYIYDILFLPLLNSIQKSKNLLISVEK